MRTLIDFYLQLPKKFKIQNAFAIRISNGDYIFKTYLDLLSDATDLALGLEESLFIREKAAIFADNSYEWMVSSIAITLLGAVDVPRASDVTDSDIIYILNHSEAKILFVENETVLNKVLSHEMELKHLKEIILLHSKSEFSSNHFKNSKISISSFSKIAELGKLKKKNLDYESIFRNKKISENDLFTLIYTSGTTGTPKGVMLSHSNIIFQLENLPIKLNAGDKTLSILPVWHIFERIFEIFSMHYGACTYYSSVRTLKDDLKKVRPEFMASAPRLWESIYTGIQSNVSKSSRIKKYFFSFSVSMAKQFYLSKQILLGKEMLLTQRNFFVILIRKLFHLFRFLFVMLPYFFCDLIVLSKIRIATGGNLKGSVSGGGALPYHVDQFFNVIGIPVLEGYGMTETSPVIAMRTFEEIIPGTVGKIFPKTNIRLIDIHTGEIFLDMEKNKFEYGRKGEIHVKGNQVMQGYYKNPEATNKTLVNGWLNTGDLGIFTVNGCLKIVGRTKETIVLLGGENVEPVPIETKILESEWIDQCMVVGQDKKYLSVLVYPNVGKADSLLKSQKFANELDLIKKLESEVKSKINTQSGFKSFERIVGIIVVPKPFEVGDELTAKLSLKRHTITEKYQDRIEDLYLGQ